MEHSAAPADQPKAAVHTEQAKDEPITEIQQAGSVPPPEHRDTVICPWLREAATGKSEQLLRLRAPFYYEDEPRP